MKTFKRSFVVAAPVEAVARFHSDTRALKRLNLPGLFLQFHRLEPVAEGSLADFTIWLGPIPIRWQASHFDVDTNRGFTDVQTRGPFAQWRHCHSFEILDDQNSRVSDEIKAQPGSLISHLMWAGMPLLFAYRAWRTRRILEKDYCG